MRPTEPDGNSPSPSELDERIEQANRLLVQNPQETLALAQAILETAANGFPTHYARALRTRAMAQGALGNFDASGADFQNAIALAQVSGDPLLESQALHGLGNVHFFRGELALALEKIHASNAIRREIGDDGGLLTGLNTLGAILAPTGDLQGATACFFDSLEIARRMGSAVNEALALTNVASMKLDSGQPEEAIAYLEESLQVAESVNSRIYQPFTLVFLSSALRQCKRLEEALEAAEKSVRISREVDNFLHETNSLEAVAFVEIERGNYDRAEEVLQEAIQIIEKKKSLNASSIYSTLGTLYRKMGCFDKSVSALNKGLEYAVANGQKQEICKICLAFAELHASVGDYEKAYVSYAEYHEHYKALQRESLSHRLEVQLSQLEMRRAQEEAERHRRQMVELAEANRENEKLLERIQEQTKRLAELAITDPLTGLYNRRYLYEYLANETSELKSTTKRLSIALLDLDNFKQINDRLSHNIGDAVLKRVARLLQKTVRDEDIVVRLGGEEFVVILPGLRRPEAVPVCEAIRQAIAEDTWTRIHPQLQVTASIGIADTWEEAPHRESMEFYHERFLQLADTRLYQAKAMGKNRIL